MMRRNGRVARRPAITFFVVAVALSLGVVACSDSDDAERFNFDTACALGIGAIEELGVAENFSRIDEEAIETLTDIANRAADGDIADAADEIVQNAEILRVIIDPRQNADSEFDADDVERALRRRTLARLQFEELCDR